MSEEWFVNLAESDEQGKAEYGVYKARRQIEASMQGGQSAAEAKLASQFNEGA